MPVNDWLFKTKINFEINGTVAVAYTELILQTKISLHKIVQSQNLHHAKNVLLVLGLTTTNCACMFL